MHAQEISAVVLGRTGLTVSRLAIGALDALDAPTFKRAVELGINFFITYPDYEREQQAIRGAVRGSRRNDVVLAGGSAGASAAAVRRDLRRSLGNLKTDYLDIFYLYHVTCDTWPAICAAGGAFEALDRARRDGTVRFTGVTVHNRHLALTIIRSGLVDVANLRYSLAHTGHERRVLPAAVRQNCGVVAYSALKQGLLIRRPDGWSARRRVPTAEECYRFVLGHPAVHAVWVGARDIEQIETAARVIRPFVPLPSATERALRQFGRFLHDARPGIAQPSLDIHRGET